MNFSVFTKYDTAKEIRTPYTNPEKTKTTAHGQPKNTNKTWIFTKEKPKQNTLVFDLGFDWRKEWDSLRDIQIITCFKFHSILTLIFCHNVAITPGLQTTVSSVVWSACFCCCILYRLQADFQPVRIPQLTKKKFGNTLRVSEFFGGKSGIRTHDALPHTWFRVRAVMTTSIPFRKSIIILSYYLRFVNDFRAVL